MFAAEVVHHVISTDPVIWSAVGGIVVPLIVALLTKWHASRGLKGTVNAVLSAGAGVIAIAATTGNFDATQLVLDIAAAFSLSISTYYGVWEPTGVAPAIGRATANVGVGPVNSPTA